MPFNYTPSIFRCNIGLSPFWYAFCHANLHGINGNKQEMRKKKTYAHFKMKSKIHRFRLMYEFIILIWVNRELHTVCMCFRQLSVCVNSLKPKLGTATFSNGKKKIDNSINNKCDFGWHALLPAVVICNGYQWRSGQDTQFFSNYIPTLPSKIKQTCIEHKYSWETCIISPF